jgi:hypothetical protein
MSCANARAYIARIEAVRLKPGVSFGRTCLLAIDLGATRNPERKHRSSIR